eukprot:1808643-Pleurochrysis_carterae.AAC.1
MGKIERYFLLLKSAQLRTAGRFDRATNGAGTCWNGGNVAGTAEAQAQSSAEAQAQSSAEAQA